MAACADTSTTFGGLLAFENLINSSSPPSIVSISYGECEAQNGASANAAYFSAYQQAVAEGVSVFVAAGDSGGAGCDNSVAEATHGIAVNAFASTPYNLAVGGTDFGDTVAGSNASYWNSTNTAAFGSAISYVPEIPWNDSCASQFVSAYFGYSPTYGATSLCNDPVIGSLLMTTVAGGGGPSACATGSPSTAGVVSGSCAGWPKPAWQSVLGNPADAVRDTPDVSLFAADGLWSHYYIFCWSDTANGGAKCGSDPSAWSGAGGTSFASPIMAGIQALINQKTGGPAGNPAPVYYRLAAAEYGSTGSSSCNSSSGANVAANCIFYDVTQGDMDVDCVGPDCDLDGAPVGVLSTNDNSFAPAFGASTGWDFATGIGTVNAANLVNNWPAAAPPQGSFTLGASSGTASVAEGTTGGAVTITITPAGGFAGSVGLAATGLPNGVPGHHQGSERESRELHDRFSHGDRRAKLHSVCFALEPGHRAGCQGQRHHHHHAIARLCRKRGAYHLEPAQRDNRRLQPQSCDQDRHTHPVGRCPGHHRVLPGHHYGQVRRPHREHYDQRHRSPLNGKRRGRSAGIAPPSPPTRVLTLHLPSGSVSRPVRRAISGVPLDFRAPPPTSP
jgi:hypothetical protein